MPCDLWGFSTLVGRDTNHSRSCVYFGNYFLCSIGIFFPQTWVVSSHTVLFNIQVKVWGGALCRSLKLSPCKALFSEVLFFVNFSCFGLPRLPACLHHTGETAGTLCCSLETLSRQKLAIVGITSLVSPLSGIAILCCLMLMFENCCFIYFI